MSNIRKSEPEFTAEHLYSLTERYVGYYCYTGRFTLLLSNFSLQDLIHEVFVKFLEKNLIGRYREGVTTQAYYVCIACRNELITLSRRQRACSSLDDVPSEMLVDKTDAVGLAVSRIDTRGILDQIPRETTSRAVGVSKITGERVNLSIREVAEHLSAGYSTQDITEMFINPSSNRPVSRGRVGQMVAELREYLLDNVVVWS